MSAESTLSAGVSLHGHQSLATYGSLNVEIIGCQSCVPNLKLEKPLVTGTP